MQSDFMEQIEKQLDALFKEKALQILNQKDVNENNPPLYHYTSLQSAVNIIQTNKLRFANAHYLNDPNEIKLGLDICEKVILQLIKEYASSKEQVYADMLTEWLLRLTISFGLSNASKQKAKSLKSKLKEYMNEQRIDALINFCDNDPVQLELYVSCLSEKSDDLRQWIPYADNAQGVALELRPLKSDFSFPITDGTQMIAKDRALYNDSKWEEFVYEFLKDALKLYKENEEQISGNFETSKILVSLISVIAACKSSHYSDEQEWRLFFVRSSHNKPAPLFYVKDGLLRPYYDILLQPNAITGIKLGPKCNNELNSNSFKVLFASKGLNKNGEISITKSEIEYRG